MSKIAVTDLPYPFKYIKHEDAVGFQLTLQFKVNSLEFYRVSDQKKYLIDKLAALETDFEKEIQSLKELLTYQTGILTMTNHKDRAHAKLSPSSMGRVMKCPGSVVMCEGIEQVESEFAKEGTLAHEIAEAYGSIAIRGIAKLKTALANRDNKYDDEMHHYATEYAKFLKMLCDKFKPNKAPLFEVKTKYSDNIWGTVDFVAAKENKDSFDLLLVDYKYGKGVEVSAEDNAQLMTYACCIASEIMNRTGLELLKAYTYIYQPRVGDKAYQRAVYTFDDLNSWSLRLDNIEKVVALAEKNGPEKYLNAQGLNHCRFCLAKSKCPEFLKESRQSALIEMGEEDPKIPAVKELTLEQKVNIFKVKKDIERYLSEVEHSLLTEAMQGIEIPGYKIVSGMSRRRWVEDENKVVSKLHSLGVKDPYKKSLIGIGEAEKLIEGSKKEVTEKLVTITEKPPGKLQLAPENDKRTALSFTSRDDAVAAMDDE